MDFHSRIQPVYTKIGDSNVNVTVKHYAKLEFRLYSEAGPLLAEFLPQWQEDVPKHDSASLKESACTLPHPLGQEKLRYSILECKPHENATQCVTGAEGSKYQDLTDS
eukprot:5355931-Amphidinium_carterae.2